MSRSNEFFTADDSSTHVGLCGSASRDGSGISLFSRRLFQSQEFSSQSVVPPTLGASLSHATGSPCGDQIQEWDVSSRCIPQLPAGHSPLDA